MEINMPKQVEMALFMLNEKDFEAYIVGGCVRDSIMGRKPSDWDITTSATPHEICEVFKKYKTVLTGIKHGTVTVIIDHFHIEVTTFRTEGEYSDNRRPDYVEFTKSIKEDLSRRDFTMNALAYSPKSGIVDMFGGIEDIKNKILRCVGNADTRFKEDALRIMRGVRFASVLSFEIEENTRVAIHKNRELLKNIAVERIAVEFNKLLLGDYVEKILHEYKDVIAVFIPEIEETFDFDQRNYHHIFDVWGHIIAAIAASPKLIYVRLALFFHDIAKPSCLKFDNRGIGHFAGHQTEGKELSKKILRRLKYDGVTMKIVPFLVRYHDAALQPDKTEIKMWLKKYGKTMVQLLYEVKIADNMAKNRNFPSRLIEAKEGRAILRKIIKNDECYSLSQLKICGRDLIEVGFPENHELGVALDKLLDAVILGKCENEKETLVKYACTFGKKVD
ncbi:MAG: CCA tRNA nucleotidyltransferase [Ruminococcaceae bacterium]|nr:CCA tRNA nucleotidyltransferase [Oscillospiraceae bacterium]